MKTDNKRGRPSVVEQIQTTSILRPYYLQTYSVEKTATKVKRNRHTVRKRFRLWEKEDIAKLKDALEKGDILHQAEFLRSNQSLIDDALDSLDEINEDILNARKAGELYLVLQFIQIKDKIRRTLMILYEKRYAAKISPGAEKVVDQVLEERIKKYVKPILPN